MNRRAKKPIPIDETLEYKPVGLTWPAQQIVSQLNNDKLVESVETLKMLCQQIIFGDTEDGKVWKHLKNYHLKLLSYQLAKSIVENKIPRKNDYNNMVVT